MAALRNLTTRHHPSGPRRPSRYRLHHQIPVTTTKTCHQAHHPTNHLTRLCRPPAQLTELPLSAALSRLTGGHSYGPGRWRAPSCILRTCYPPSGGQVIRRGDRGDGAFLLDDFTHHLLLELLGVSRCWHSLHPIDPQEKIPRPRNTMHSIPYRDTPVSAARHPDYTRSDILTHRLHRPVTSHSTQRLIAPCILY